MVVLLLFGCSSEKDYQVDVLDLQRHDWDAIQVDVQFAEAKWLGSARRVVPEELAVVAYDASYDTLYAGDDTLISIPDERLGDRESVVVEVCGTFEEATLICDQAGLTASPKRVEVDPDLEYPKSGDMGEGRYRFSFTVERQRYGSDDWERVQNPAPLETYLLAYVEDAEDGAIRVPLHQNEGRFNLAQHANHDEFDYQLRSGLMSGDEVRVRFDVHAGLNAQPPQHVTTVERSVRRLTREERAREVEHFAEQVAEQLLDDVLQLSENPSASVYIDRWDYRDALGRYDIEMEVRWRSGFLGFSEYRLFGELSLEGDGSNVRFEMTDGNRRGRQIWREEIDGRELELRDLEHPEDLEPEEPPRITGEGEEERFDPTHHAIRPPASL